jgi:putative SOS response-associated peptidase YedK
MCGRARLPQDYSEIKRRIKFADDFPAINLRPSWNITPTQDLLCAVLENGQRKPVSMYWGLVPPRAPEFKMDWKYKTFNAVGETLEEKRTFLPAWVAGRRCLIITDGFYEWSPIDKKTKQAWAIGRADGGLMVMAGLWEPWRKNGETRASCTVITTPANAAMLPIHHRMPVILSEKDWPVWLGEEDGDPAALMKPCANEDLKIWKVGPEVGKSTNNGPELIAAI